MFSIFNVFPTGTVYSGPFAVVVEGHESVNDWPNVIVLSYCKFTCAKHVALMATNNNVYIYFMIEF